MFQDKLRNKVIKACDLELGAGGDCDAFVHVLCHTLML